MKFQLFLGFLLVQKVVSFQTLAHLISQPGKGILAADESIPTIGKRFEAINVENTEKNRYNYRKLLFTTPDLEKYISGVILHTETLENRELVSFLENKGIVPGIKLDLGLTNLPTTNEPWVKGMDTLAERAQESYKLGARFAKWRAVFKITENTPSNLAIIENCWSLARYAKTVQEAGLIPIVEPEILMDGNHTIEKTMHVQSRIFKNVYKCLYENNVDLEKTLLKPSFTCQGINNYASITDMEIAQATLQTLHENVPLEVPGIMFLSGGLSEQKASRILNCLNKKKPSHLWNLSFSFGRALQNSCLQTWQGKYSNIQQAQQTLLETVKSNSQASLGIYNESPTPTNEETSLFVKNYSY
jgi:fructose-bisphosphate aldolase class I